MAPVWVRQVCTMEIYPTGCQKKYIEEELPSRFLHFYDFSFFTWEKTLHYPLTEITTEMGSTLT